MDRRQFLEAALVAVASSRSWAVSGAPAPGGIQGANNRIRVAIIGTGSRGNQVMQSWLSHKDSVFTAICDVAKDRLDNTASKLASAGHKVDTYEDYRKILERKDIDAVLIATPDHWHSPMTIEACAAGKDVYCEKPVSNQIDPALKMLDAARQYNRVVQIGLQQRSWPLFMEAAKLVQEGGIGVANHVVMAPPGGGGGGGQQQTPPQPTDPPPTLNWEMFQGPAARKQFVQQRLNWRGWYDYGGGNITDWGVHIVDVMNWYLKMDEKTPQVVQAAAQYVRSPVNLERIPDTYVVTMRYDNLVATLSNAALFGPNNEPWWGNYFYGDRALMLVNREGYEVRPRPAPAGRGGRGGRGAAPGAAPGATAAPPVPPAPPQPLAKAVKVGFAGGGGDTDSSMVDATAAHIRNFLDCMRSRERPTADIAIGLNSTLPTLLAIESIKAGGKAFTWDAKARKASPV
jgi:predicted dehydrogenase